jgi:superfamily II DNA or RNA helicase/diadenosine tetraphosphate (Ap4A) HIT family hydrolase
MIHCPFCESESARVFHEGDLFRCLWDGFPVAEGHALIITRRHVPDWFDARQEELIALLEGIAIARAEVLARFEPDGFNIGVNVGEAAGQTISHLHIHLIPRYKDDVADPRGGVRSVIPGQGNYLALPANQVEIDADALFGSVTGGASSRISEQRSPVYEFDSPRVVGSDTNPIIDHLVRDLARAKAVDIAVAFVTNRGLGRVLPHLDDLVTRGGQLRFLTGDYLGVTDPEALRRLLDLETENDGVIEIRIFECSDMVGFHPKAYLIYGHHEHGAAYVGSSNLTDHGLARGIEWNYRIGSKQDTSGYRAIAAEFEELFQHPHTNPLTSQWIDRYQSRRPTSPPVVPVEIIPEPTQPPVPNPIQAEALEALRRTREVGNRAGLVVLATGLGKTWLSAFDAQSFRRVLFVAHREEILAQARRTFRAIRPNATLGHYTGSSKDPGADVVFASIQTIGKAGHLARFDARAFDYVVVDEFHHADAKTYRRLIDHFDPAFLLGLTATPERTDGGDLLALCGENLVYRCDLAEGIEQLLLCPFHYYGIPDQVQYENIPWRSGRFDERALESAVATEARATNAFEQWKQRGGTRTLAFCVSQRHADFMAAFFEARGVACASVHAGATSAPRALSLEQLEAGNLQIVFSVDMFNEGVDLPAVDTVLLLRPTESRILWLQQFGRGLRLADDKTHLTVIDYVGNHQTFLKVPMLLFPDVGDSPGEVALALEQYEKGEIELPPGCSVTYDLEAIEILKSLIRIPRGVGALQAWYEIFRHRNGIRPTALETWHAGHDPKSVRRSHGSWTAFVATMGDLDEKEREAQRAAESFLRELETTPMTKSYKMVVLLTMIGEEAFPGSIPVDTLTQAVTRRVHRTAVLTAEFGVSLDDHDALRRLLIENPIAAWAGGKGTGGSAYFTHDGDEFTSQVDCSAAATLALRELTQELCDWRLGQYLERIQADAGHAPRFVGSVGHTNGRPIIFLPDRKTNPGIPHDWTTVETMEGPLELKFVKIAINVARRPRENENVLPSVLRSWFGPSAGLPGEGPHKVLFELEQDHYRLKPIGMQENQPVIGGEYSRADIAPLWQLPFEDATWRQSGFIWTGTHMFLLVTLEKQGMREEHQYQDRFLDAEHFQWQSQNRTPQGGKVGQALRHHHDRGIAVHLFVRRFPKTQRGKAAPFMYCGDLDFQSWEGEKPITIRWRLTKPLPGQLLRNFVIAES